MADFKKVGKIEGPEGPEGPKGKTGDTGEPGSKGPKGDKGDSAIEDSKMTNENGYMIFDNGLLICYGKMKLKQHKDYYLFASRDYSKPFKNSPSVTASAYTDSFESEDVSIRHMHGPVIHANNGERATIRMYKNKDTSDELKEDDSIYVYFIAIGEYDDDE